MNKKFFRCCVCNDIHFGIDMPETCPTCRQKNAYIECDIEEATKMMEL